MYIRLKIKADTWLNFLNKSNLDLSPQRTVELQKDLKKVYNSKITVDECVQNAIAFLNQYFEKCKQQGNTRISV